MHASSRCGGNIVHHSTCVTLSTCLVQLYFSISLFPRALLMRHLIMRSGSKCVSFSELELANIACKTAHRMWHQRLCHSQLL